MERLAAVVMLMVCVSAQAEDPVEASRNHFRVGQSLHEAGRFAEAVREFQLGYDLVPRPEFLFNMGQSYHRMGDARAALRMYEKYLAEAPANGRYRRATLDLVTELRAEVARLPPEPPPAMTAPSTTAPATTAPATTTTTRLADGATPVAIDRPALTLAPPPRHKSFARRQWWIFPVGVAVVGVAVGLGVYFGLPRCAERLGCVNATGL